MILDTVISGIIDLVLGKAGVAIAPADKAEIQKRAMELARDSEKNIIDNLNKQADINQVLANTGKLGWRNFLAWSLTFCVVFQVLQGPLIAVGIVLMHACGMSYPEILDLGQSIKAILPPTPPIDTVSMLMGLCGLYGWRGYEKTQILKNFK